MRLRRRVKFDCSRRRSCDRRVDDDVDGHQVAPAGPPGPGASGAMTGASVTLGLKQFGPTLMKIGFLNKLVTPAIGLGPVCGSRSRIVRAWRPRVRDDTGWGPACAPVAAIHG